jgi:hypothetical protein
MLSLLAEAGVDAVLLNCLDGGVMAAAGAIQRGGPGIEALAQG